MIRVLEKNLLVLSTVALLTLSACSQQSDTAAKNTVAPATESISASTSAGSTPAAPLAESSVSAIPSASTSPKPVTTLSLVPTPVVQEETESTRQVVPEPTVDISGPATTSSPTASVITIPAPGNTVQPSAKVSASLVASNQCDYGSIHISAATTEGAAGSRYITLTFTNIGSASCSISGWPSVNYVDASGQVIGAPASRAAEWTSSGEILAPGDSATATLRETRANLYGDSCQAVTASGYQVGIPGTENSLTLSFPAEACSNTSISQLSVGQVGAGS